MNVILPDGSKVFMDSGLEYEDRIKVVTAILDDWQDHFRKTWDMNKTKVSLDVMSTYICATNYIEDKHKEDKFVLSRTKVRKMRNGDSKKVNFSDLPLEDQQLLGIAEPMEENY